MTFGPRASRAPHDAGGTPRGRYDYRFFTGLTSAAMG